MKIAVIGWGSLIWRQGDLNLASRWHKDGPCLPIEFARISQDKRLTLVIVSENEAKTQQTLWAFIGLCKIPQARENLKEREGTSNIENIAYWQKGMDTESSIGRWAEQKKLDAVIWTAFGKKPELLSDDQALQHLQSLPADIKKRAEEYIRKTPQQINTRRRQLFRKEFGWNDIPLRDELFEY